MPLTDITDVSLPTNRMLNFSLRSNQFAIMELPLLKDANKQECWWKIISRFARVWEVKNSYTRDRMVQWKVWYPRKSRSIQKNQFNEGNIYTVEDCNMYDARSRYRSMDYPLLYGVQQHYSIHFLCTAMLVFTIKE